MNSPVGWWVPGVAVVATILAIAAGRNLAVAIPAASVAVAAAAIVLASAPFGRGPLRASAPPAPVRSEPDRLRFAFRSGELGRADLVALLDRLEREGPRPDLPTRSVAELEEIVRLPAREFDGYVLQRVEELEAAP